MVECAGVWCGVVCYGVVCGVWCGVVCNVVWCVMCGVVWCGVVGCDVERGMVWGSGTWCSVVHFEAKLFTCVGPD